LTVFAINSSGFYIKVPDMSLNEDCKNNKIEYCDIGKDSRYCYLCGSLTTIGEFDESTS
jgi:hypothetical protein